MWHLQLNNMHEGGATLLRNLVMPNHPRWSIAVQFTRNILVTTANWLHHENCCLRKVGIPELEVMAIWICRLEPLGSHAEAVSSSSSASPEVFKKALEKTTSPF